MNKVHGEKRSEDGEKNKVFKPALANHLKQKTGCTYNRQYFWVANKLL